MTMNNNAQQRAECGDISQMLEIKLPNDETFLQVKETLTRIGIANTNERKLYQSCHILKKAGKYYIVHFKEMFILDGKPNNMTCEDISRRNRIGQMLADWGLVKIVNMPTCGCVIEHVNVFVLRHSEKNSWNLISKYTIGGKK